MPSNCTVLLDFENSKFVSPTRSDLASARQELDVTVGENERIHMQLFDEKKRYQELTEEMDKKVQEANAVVSSRNKDLEDMDRKLAAANRDK